MRKFVDHPAYQPVTHVSEFKSRTMHVVLDNDTQQVVWSSESELEANLFGATIAATLHIDAAVVSVCLAHV